MACVYSLSSSLEPDDIRYIGRSKHDDAEPRRKEHLTDAGRKTRTYKQNWIKSAQSAGGEIVSTVLESGLSWDESAVREVFFIAHYRSLGYALTNLTDGGDGCLGHVPSAETRAKNSASQKGRTRKPHTAETRVKMSKTQRMRKPASAETCAKISESKRGKPLSAEHCAQISATKKERSLSVEDRTKLGNGNRGKTFSAERCAKMGASRLGKKRGQYKKS